MTEGAPRHARVNEILLWVIFLFIAWLYLLLIFTDRVPVVGLVGLGALWLLYAVLTGWQIFVTPLDLPILALLGLLPLNLAISVDQSLTLPKVYGLILGIAIFYWLVQFVRNYQRLKLAIFGLILLGIGAAILGGVGMDWSTSRFAALAAYFQPLTNWLPAIPRQISAGIHANTAGGVLTLFVPLLAALALDRGAFYRLYLRGKKHAKFIHVLYKAVLLIALLLVLVVVALSDSRGAILGSGVGLFALAVWKDRRFLWLLPLVIIGLGILFFLAAGGNTFQLIEMLETSEESTYYGRLTVWRNTLAVIQDFPLTGVGMGTLGQVFNEFYHYTIFVYNPTNYLHAHNTFLAAAVDLGIPALVLYASLLTTSALMIKRRLKIGRSILKTLLQGLACGLLAFHIFGLMDAFVLGTKLGAVLWIFLGLVSAVYVHKEGFRWQRSLDADEKARIITTKPGLRLLKARTLDILICLGLWLLISFAAISFVDISALLSVIMAIAGGIFLGIFLLQRHRRIAGSR